MIVSVSFVRINMSVAVMKTMMTMKIETKQSSSDEDNGGRTKVLGF